MKSGQLISGLVAGSIVGAALGYMMHQRPKRMSLMRKGLKLLRM